MCIYEETHFVILIPSPAPIGGGPRYPSDTNQERRTGLFSKVSAQFGLRDYLGGDSWGPSGSRKRGVRTAQQEGNQHRNLATLVTRVRWARLAGPNRHHANTTIKAARARTAGGDVPGRHYLLSLSSSVRAPETIAPSFGYRGSSAGPWRYALALPKVLQCKYWSRLPRTQTFGGHSKMPGRIEPTLTFRLGVQDRVPTRRIGHCEEDAKPERQYIVYEL